MQNHQIEIGWDDSASDLPNTTTDCEGLMTSGNQHIEDTLGIGVR